MKPFLLFTAFITSQLLFGQNLWNDSDAWNGSIPRANNNVTLDEGVWEVPTGFVAECKSLTINGAGAFQTDTELIVNGTLIVNRDFKMESDILAGLFLKPVKVTIGPNGKLVLKDDMKFKGDASAMGDKEIIVNGILEVEKELNLENDDDDETGLLLTIGNTGVINLSINNDDDEAMITPNGGSIVFSDDSRVNFSAPSGEQFIGNWITFPNIGVTSGATVLMTENMTSANISGNIIVENGIFDLSNKDLSGNGTNQIIVQENGTLRIGGSNGFPVSNGGVNEFIAPDLQKGSTVEYDGGNQGVAGFDYWNLIVSEGDTKELADAVSVAGVLTVDDNVELDVTSNTLTIVSTGEGLDETGMIGPVDGTIVGDNVIVQRYINLKEEPNNRFGWNDWCSPIVHNQIKSWTDQGVRTSGFPGSNSPGSSFNSVLWYDASSITNNKNEGWVGASNVTDEIGLGNAVRFYDGNIETVLKDKGSVHVGDYTVNLKYKDIGKPGEEGFNLLGNPYACPIDWTQLYNNGTTGSVYNAFWLYSNGTGYYTYNGLTGVGTGLYEVQNEALSSGLIASHKGFWVKATGPGATMTFKESYKNTGGAVFLKSNTPDNELLRVQIESDMNGYKSAAVLVMNDQASMNVDQFDANYFAHPLAAAPGIGFVEPAGQQLSINTIPKTPSFKEIPLFLKIGKNGSYRIRFYELEKMDSQHCIAFVDTETNTTYNIREEPVITLNLTKDVAPNRFKLVIGSPLQAEKLKDITCFGDNDGQVLISWLAGPTSYYDVYKNNEIIYSNFQQTLFIKDVEPGVFKVIPNDADGYCEGAFYEVNVFEPKVVIAQIAAPDVIDEDEDDFGTLVTFYNVSAGGSSFQWDFGDGFVSFEEVPQHVYDEPGTYQVQLIVNNMNAECADTTYHELTIVPKSTVNISDYDYTEEESLYKVLRGDGFYLIRFNEANEAIKAKVYNINGQELDSYYLGNGTGGQLRINTDAWSTGMYILKMQVGAESFVEKLVK
jgi:hypothetical protein